MKALTMWQPWASFLMLQTEPRLKAYETRSWRTYHTGRIVIHAAKKEPADVRSHWLDDGARRALIATRLGPYADYRAHRIYDDLPRGVALGTVDLIECVRCFTVCGITDVERELGDWSGDRWAWLTFGPTPFHEPIEYRGHQGLWNFPDELLPS